MYTYYNIIEDAFILLIVLEKVYSLSAEGVPIEKIKKVSKIFLFTLLFYMAYYPLLIHLIKEFSHGPIHFYNARGG